MKPSRHRQYMLLVDMILKKHKMTPIRQRTYFQFIFNFEHCVTSAVSYVFLKVDCEIAGIWPFSLYQFISRFAGARSLDDKDYETIVAHFPYLVGVAYWLGYVDPEVRGATESKAFHRNNHKELGSGSLELLQCVASKCVETNWQLKNPPQRRRHTSCIVKSSCISCVMLLVSCPVKNVDATFFKRVLQNAR
jgi:hypothetical protein